MRAINLLYLGIIAMMCVFCNDSGSHAPHRTYFLSLSFVDTEGNDLVKGLRGIEPEDSDKPDYVAPDLYTLVSSPDRYEVGLYSNPNALYENAYRYPKLELAKPGKWNVWETSDFYLLGISMPIPTESDLEKITYTLTCPHVFGDNAEHEIVTYWREHSNSHGSFRVCDRVEVDGKEFTDIYWVNDGYFSHATIVLDR